MNLLFFSFRVFKLKLYALLPSCFILFDQNLGLILVDLYNFCLGFY